MNTKTLYLDLETFSKIDIRKAGTYKYASESEILLFAYAVNNAPARVIDVTYEHDAIERIEELINSADKIVAHNSMFDRNVLNCNGFKTDNGKWRDTMIKAYSHSLTGGLDQLCTTMGIGEEVAKSKDGKKLIQLFCKPLGKNRILARADRSTHPEEWARFVEYARLDVEAMRAIDQKMPNWNMAIEHKHWLLDQRINDRGFCVDTELVDAALKAIAIEKIHLAAETYAMTDGAVASATQAAVLTKYILDEFGIELPNMQKATIEAAVNDPNMPVAVRDLLVNRLQASTSSTSKYAALERSVNDDGRLRGTLQFAGAARTGRWAGRVFQPQNLPRPTYDNDFIEQGIEALKLNCAELMYDDIMALTSSAIRGCIVAPKGSKLCVSDLSNIEGRVQAWLADESWKIKAFEDFDNGIGPDLYKLAYAKSFAVSHESVTKDQRQIGKVQELALGYGGGVGAFATFADAYGIDLDQLADQVWHTLPCEEVEASKRWLAVRKNDPLYEATMSDRAFVLCDTLKRMWRNAHPNISALWYSLEDACKSAVENPRKVFYAGKIAVRRDGAWLRIKLPSGRYLCYPSVRIKDGQLQYKGKCQFTTKWKYLSTYGGKLFENICQAMSRDILAENMHTIDEAGYAIVLTIHDEVICETPDSAEYTHKKLSALLAANPSWCLDMPLAADGFESYRYKKD